MHFNKLLLSRAVTALAVAGFLLSLGSEAVALERQLAGVTLGAQVTSVLKKYGRP